MIVRDHLRVGLICPETLGIASRGLFAARGDLSAVTGARIVRIAGNARGVDAIGGWGHKPTAAPARRLARESGLRYFAFEDGFIRSVKAGAVSAPLSYVIDDNGIYYDAATPSRLEKLLQDTSWADGATLARAGRLIDRIRELRLSKFNSGADDATKLLLMAHDRRPIVMVVDQLIGDASVHGALAGAAAFARMLAAARAEHPAARIIVKAHPAAAATGRSGYLAPAARRGGIECVDANINPWVLLERARAVYTVSSQLGFEALLAGVPVTCFGMPFYAGWGLTDDRVVLPRRTGRPSLQAIAAAALIHYAAYLDPWRRNVIEPERAIDALAFLRDRYHEIGRPIVTCNLSRWKRRSLAPFFSARTGALRHCRTAAGALNAARGGQADILVWGMRHPELDAAAAASGSRLLRVEDGFIRSVGLGAAFVAPASITVDDGALYYRASGKSRFEQIAASAELDRELIQRARWLREAIVRGHVTKYNLPGCTPPPAIDRPRRRILVPGQVEDDASVIWGAADVRTNLDLLRAVRKRHPEAFILFRPHPDVAAGLRVGGVAEKTALQYADLVSTAQHLPALFSWCDHVETMTSLTGFEALIRGRSVAVHGRPFYAGWGVTEDLVPLDGRQRRLTIDELVAVSLILYPRYIDPVTRLPAPPEVVVERFQAVSLRRDEAGDRRTPLWRQSFMRALTLAGRRMARAIPARG